MEKVFTVVLSDSDVLSQVCGTNDCNLKRIESFLGTPVYTRGNELSVEAEDEDIHRKFKFIIDRITDEIAEGGKCSPDLLESILNTGFVGWGRRASDSRVPFNAGDCAISIPGGTHRVYPKTPNQVSLVSSFRSHDLVFAVGPAGSGKTFLAVAEALRLAMSKRVSSIILTRPIVEAGESLGFLPGNLEEKINPYLRPLYDSMGRCLPRDVVARLVESGIVEIAPLAYMRGRTLSNCVVILDEAQNTTAEQMKMFLTRMGENAKVFITGDVTQVDLPKKQRSGLVHALGILRGIPEIGIVELDGTDVVRSTLVRKIVAAYEADAAERFPGQGAFRDKEG